MNILFWKNIFAFNLLAHDTYLSCISTATCACTSTYASLYTKPLVTMFLTAIVRHVHRTATYVTISLDTVEQFS